MIHYKFCIYCGFVVCVNIERPESFFRGLFEALQNCKLLNNYIHLQPWINELTKVKLSTITLENAFQKSVTRLGSQKW